jgi:hypothetical protein
VYSYGEGSVDPTAGTDESSGDSGSSDDSAGDGSSDDDDGDDGWGHCRPRDPPPDRGDDPRGHELRQGPRPLHDPRPGRPRVRALQVPRLQPDRRDRPDRSTPSAPRSSTRSTSTTSRAPGEPGTIELDQLWGNYTYQIGVTYEDRCGNEQPLATATITTPAQKFQQVEGFCFLATAAYGAPWTVQVQALRWFRDAYLKVSPLGRDLVRFYYTHSPPLAAVVRHQPLLRGMVRVVLQPVTDAIRLGP